MEMRVCTMERGMYFGKKRFVPWERGMFRGEEGRDEMHQEEKVLYHGVRFVL